MGCDETTFSALNLALMNSMEPETGSVLLFLMAAPGETEFFLRRPGDDLPERWELNLGSATWFNEPVLRALLFLAPFIEQLLPEALHTGVWRVGLVVVRIRDRGLEVAHQTHGLELVLAEAGCDAAAPELRHVGGGVVARFKVGEDPRKTAR